MTYCTQQDLVDRFGSEELIQLTDRTNVPPTTVDGDVVDRALDDAAAVIDSYVGKRYALPLANPPAVLGKVSADLAHYFLLGNTADKDSQTASLYRDALAWLAAVAAGTVELPASGDAPEPAGDAQVEYSASPRVFTRDSLRRF